MAECLRIIIVDDDDVDRMAVKRALRQAGFEVQTEEAASAAAAIEMLIATPFDCVFLDYNLPDTTGLEFIRSLTAAGLRLPVVMMTGQGDEEIAVELMKAGASDYIPKNAMNADRIRNVPTMIRAFRAERQLRDTEERMRLALESARIGTWEMNPQSGERLWSERTREILGVGPDYEPTAGAFGDIVHSEDRDRVRAAIANALNPAMRADYNEEFRVVRGDGTVIWVHATGRAIFLGAGSSAPAIRFLGTLSEVTAQKEAAAALQESIRLRDEVLAIVSHDLRNPLNTLLACASLLSDIPLTPEQTQKQLDIIKRTGRQMNRLLQDLLDVSRIEAGSFHVETHAVGVAQIVADVCSMFEQQAARKSLLLTCDVSDELPSARADRDRLVQALSNLLSNAVRLTPAGGQIQVHARAANDYVVFSVADTGPGIAADELPHVFERFWQARRANRSGAGLGLAIVKGIVEAHGGLVRVESEVGRGTTFEIGIPAARVPVAADS